MSFILEICHRANCTALAKVYGSIVVNAHEVMVEKFEVNGQLVNARIRVYCERDNLEHIFHELEFYGANVEMSLNEAAEEG